MATHQPHTQSLAADGTRGQRSVRDLPGEGYLHRHVVPGNAGCRQRRTDSRGGEPDRFRPRLPRGYLRNVRRCRQRSRSRSSSRRTTLCQLHMRQFKDGDTLVIEPWRAQAFPVIKDLVVDRSRFRPDHRRPAVTSRSTPETRPDANAIPIAQGERRQSDGCRRLHRLWGLRRRLSQRVGDAVCQRQGQPPCTAAPGPTGSRQACASDGARHGCLRIRQLHQSSRMRAGLSKGNIDCQHFAIEPRIFEGQFFVH